MNCTALYPGTFDPIHNGHVDIATRAAAVFDRVVIGIYEMPMKALLFTTDERVMLAQEAIAGIPRVEVASYDGLTVDFVRQIGAQAIVRGLRAISDFELEYQMALTNRQLAPEVESVCLMARQEHAFLSSSIVKEIALLQGNVNGMVPAHVRDALEAKRHLREKQQAPAPLYSLRD